MAERAGDLLRGIRVVPEVGGTGLLAEPRDLVAECVDVDHRLMSAKVCTERLDFGGEIEFEHDSPA